MNYPLPLTPRYYQRESVEALIEYFIQGNSGNPLVVLPTGSGKSICIAELIKRVFDWPNQRVMMLTHVKELIEQNANKIRLQWNDAPVGIYSASLKQRDLHDDIIFAGIQSVYKKAYEFGVFDLIIIDECHLLSPNSETMYQRFISDQLAMNPFLKVIGFTATPFRTSTGAIHAGDNVIFNDIAYEKSMIDLIDEGYLAPLVSKRTETEIDLSNVKKNGGEFQQKDLQLKTDTPSITESAVKEIIAYGQTRKSWLIFCAGVDHAHHINEELIQYGIKSRTVTGKTPPNEREQILNDYRSGKIKAVTNCDVLTTGFDAPETDLIALLRGTHSPGLYVQMCGRGTRPIYADDMPVGTVADRLAAIAASEKTNCLVLDFAGNVMRHGPVDQVQPWIKRKGEDGNEAPSKACPKCNTITFAAARTCSECGHEYPIETAPLHDATSDDLAILSTEKIIEEIEVADVSFVFWKGRKPIPTIRVSYLKNGTMNVRFNEWIPIFHEPTDSRAAFQRSQAWWKIFVDHPFPDFYEWQNYGTRFGVIKGILGKHYKAPAAIIINNRGKYPNIVDYITGD